MGKGILLYHTPPPIDEVGKVLLKNRQEYSEANGYEFIYSTAGPSENRHYSWATPEVMLNILNDPSKEFDWIINSGARSLYTNYNITIESMTDRYPDKDIVAVRDMLHGTEKTPLPWLVGVAENDLRVVRTQNPIVLVVPEGLFIRRTQWSKDFLTQVLTNKIFKSPVMLGLPSTLDQFLIALSMYYNEIPEVQDHTALVMNQEVGCLPTGSGEGLEKTIENIQEDRGYVYPKFKEGYFSVTIGCLDNRRVSPEEIKALVEENEKHIKKKST